jgi:hypothetical protein
MIFLDLVEMFPQVVSLEFKSVKVEAATWMTLSTHPHITTLDLGSIVITSSVASGFWRACTNLERLELTSVTIEGRAVPDDVMFFRLTSLSVFEMTGLDKSQELGLIFRCPALKDFQWSKYLRDEDDSHTVITNTIPNGWPHLEELDIMDRPDTDVASILQGIGNQHGGLIKLSLLGCTFLEQSSRALELHFSTLVYLSLSSFSVPSVVVRDILCSCPRLENLSVECVPVQDIVNGGDWVCHQLRMLTICFQLEEGEQDLQHDLFKRLSSLVRLEYLSMDCDSLEETHEHGTVEFRLENGLGQLASLKRLKTLGFYGCCPQFSMDEVAWIRIHLKQLRVRCAQFHREEQEDDKLRDAMELFGLIDV